MLTADGFLIALGGAYKEDRRFNLPLLPGHKATGISSTLREVLLSTNHGALYQLWIH